MKSSYISVEFKDPAKEIKENLMRQGARSIDVRKSYSGELEVRYTIRCADPEKEISTALERAGATNVRPSTSYSGARFDFKLDDITDEREFKKRIAELLRKSGYRAN